MSVERACLGCLTDLAGYRSDAEWCGSSCKNAASRGSAAFWGGLRRAHVSRSPRRNGSGDRRAQVTQPDPA